MIFFFQNMKIFDRTVEYENSCLFGVFLHQIIAWSIHSLSPIGGFQKSICSKHVTCQDNEYSRESHHGSNANTAPKENKLDLSLHIVQPIISQNQDYLDHQGGFRPLYLVQHLIQNQVYLTQHGDFIALHKLP